MNATTILKSVKKATIPEICMPRKKPVVTLKEHIVEIISDSGEGAQRCGQSLGSIAAKMGNGIWTVEIIPAEIRYFPGITSGIVNRPDPSTFACGGGPIIIMLLLSGMNGKIEIWARLRSVGGERVVA